LRRANRTNERQEIAMLDFFQGILVSDITLFLVMTIFLLIVTSWAFSWREYAGYLLGWLTGIVVIIFLSILFPQPADVSAQAAELPSRTNALIALLPTAFGVATGFGVMQLIKSGGRSSSAVSRALLIAFLVVLILSLWYVMALTRGEARLNIALFLLTFFIGMLFNFVISRRTVTRSVAPGYAQELTTTPLAPPPPPGTDNPNAYGNLPPAAGTTDYQPNVSTQPGYGSPVAQRMRSLRSNIRGRF
jgi:hypothetical protein